MRSGSAGEAPVAGWQEGAEPGSWGLDLGERTTGSCGDGQEGAFSSVHWATRRLALFGVFWKLKSKVSQTPFELP